MNTKPPKMIRNNLHKKKKFEIFRNNKRTKQRSVVVWAILLAAAYMIGRAVFAADFYRPQQ